MDEIARAHGVDDPAYTSGKSILDEALVDPKSPVTPKVEEV